MAGDTTNKMAFLGGEEGAALCIALLCTIVLRRRLSSKKRSTMGCISMKSIRSSIISLIHVTTGARGKDHPPFSNFLFTNLFSIKFLYFFIISSLFPYFVSIFIQSYVNIKLHVSTLSDTNNTQGMQLGRFKNLTPARFEYIYSTLFPLCHSN